MAEEGKRVPLSAKIWETFLRVEPLDRLADEAPPLDDAWMVARGIDPIAPAVLRHLRDDVIPLVTGLLEEDIYEFSFLVHAYPLVPTTEDDRSLYIHLRFKFLDHVEDDEEIVRALPSVWRMTRRFEEGEIAGVDSSVLGRQERWGILARQSEWMLDFIGAHKEEDLGVLVKHVRQYLHFFANMAQMRVA